MKVLAKIHLILLMMVVLSHYDGMSQNCCGGDTLLPYSVFLNTFKNFEDSYHEILVCKFLPKIIEDSLGFNSFFSPDAQNHFIIYATYIIDYSHTVNFLKSNIKCRGPSPSLSPLDLAFLDNLFDGLTFCILDKDHRISNREQTSFTLRFKFFF